MAKKSQALEEKILELISSPKELILSIAGKELLFPSNVPVLQQILLVDLADRRGWPWSFYDSKTNKESSPVTVDDLPQKHLPAHVRIPYLKLAEGSATKTNNQALANALLTLGIDRWDEKNYGYHWIIIDPESELRFELWPTTGRYKYKKINDIVISEDRGLVAFLKKLLSFRSLPESKAKQILSEFSAPRNRFASPSLPPHPSISPKHSVDADSSPPWD